MVFVRVFSAFSNTLFGRTVASRDKLVWGSRNGALVDSDDNRYLFTRLDPEEGQGTKSSLSRVVRQDDDYT